MAIKDISYERACELLRYDSETGLIYWRVARRHAVKAGDLAGSPSSHGYCQIIVDGRSYKAHRLGWLLHFGEWPKLHLDHINGIRDDNRICNLREATQSQNCRNHRMNKNNTSGYPGVFKIRKGWGAGIGMNRKWTFLGVYGTPEEAFEAYKKEALKLWGEFANLDLR